MADYTPQMRRAFERSQADGRERMRKLNADTRAEARPLAEKLFGTAGPKGVAPAPPGPHQPGVSRLRAPPATPAPVASRQPPGGAGQMQPLLTFGQAIWGRNPVDGATQRQRFIDGGKVK